VWTTTRQFPISQVLYRTAQELSEGLGHDGLHADTDQQQLPVLTKSALMAESDRIDQVGAAVAALTIEAVDELASRSMRRIAQPHDGLRNSEEVLVHEDALRGLG
jgi:hypothetical protein